MHKHGTSYLRRFFAIALNIRLRVCLTVATPFDRMACKVKSWQSQFLPQLRVLRLGLFQDGDVRVGVFPEGEEVLIGGAGLGGVTLQVVSAGKAESGEVIEWRIREHGAMFEHFLKFSGGCAALSELKVGLSAHIGRVEKGTGPAGAANSPAGGRCQSLHAICRQVN
jgi:hypothetical protein